MQKCGRKNFRREWLAYIILLVGAFAVAYIDMKKELVILREQALKDYFN